MTLKDLIDQIVGGPPAIEPTDERPIIPTVFARKIDEHFHQDSEAKLVEIHGAELLRRYETDGFRYFLEVSLVQELWQDWTEYLKSHPGRASPLDALFTMQRTMDSP